MFILLLQILLFTSFHHFSLIHHLPQTLPTTFLQTTFIKDLYFHTLENCIISFDISNNFKLFDTDVVSSARNSGPHSDLFKKYCQGHNGPES